MNRNTRLQFIRQILYDLKKLYGFPIVLYNITTYNLDTTTGLKTVVKDTYPIAKAIVLASDLDVRYKALLGVQKDFAYGGQTMHKDRYFIIDRKYLPNELEVTDDCYVTYDSQRYDVIKITEFEHKRAILLFGKHMENASLDQVVSVDIKQDISITNAIK